MNSYRTLFLLWLFVLSTDITNAHSQTRSKRITAEYGTDLSLSCTFQDEESDKTIVQWLYQNLTDFNSHHPANKIHWRPLFLNTQSLTPSETRYSIQQKTQHINHTSSAYTTILTLVKVTEQDEGIYMCKSLSPKTIQMSYQVRVIQSLVMDPKQVIMPADEAGQYSIRLNCILTDSHTGSRQHEIHWWHNNKRLASPLNRHARITKNVTQHSFISTLFYTGDPKSIAGSYVCESEPIRKHTLVELKRNNCTGLTISLYIIFFVEIFLAIYYH